MIWIIRAVVSYKRKYVHEVLVNCLFKLAQEKSVVRWTDHPAMTIAVDLGCKPAKQTNKQMIWIWTNFLKILTWKKSAVDKNAFKITQDAKSYLKILLVVFLIKLCSLKSCWTLLISFTLFMHLSVLCIHCICIKRILFTFLFYAWNFMHLENVVSVFSFSF